MKLPTCKNPLIEVMSPAVKRDSKVAWFNKVAALFDKNDPGHIYGERVGHLVLYANEHVRFSDVTSLLCKAFPRSLLMVKCERSTGVSTVYADGAGGSSDIVKSLHYHCYITFSPKGNDVDPDTSFKHTVFSMLTNKKKGGRFSALVKPPEDKMKPLDYFRNFKFSGYNLITATNKYNKEYMDKWDVFYPSSSKRSSDNFNNKTDKKCLALVSDDNAMRVLNWMAYAAKEDTAHGRKNCIIIDNRFKHITL